MGKIEVHPTWTETMVKVITVSKTKVMNRAIKTFESLLFIFTTGTSLLIVKQQEIKRSRMDLLQQLFRACPIE